MTGCCENLFCGPGYLLTHKAPPGPSLFRRIWLFLFNLLLSPILLVAHSISIYLLPCLYSYCMRMCCFVCCLVCQCACWVHKDKSFPPDDGSLGDFKAKAKSQVIWKRGIELCEHGTQMHLFSDGVDQQDICQGQLGDCWLLSALACLAEYPGAIESVFGNLEYNKRGKYSVRLFDAKPSANRMVNVSVDDFFPCDASSGAPLFTNPNGSELWVLLLEKAFAKFMGSYANLEGGHTVFALQTLTGAKSMTLRRDKGLTGKASNGWKCYGLKPKPTLDNPQAFVFVAEKRPFISDDSLWEMITRYHNRNAVLAAGTAGEDLTLEQGRNESSTKAEGLVPGHAYSIIDVKHPFSLGERHRLLCLRNPWGSFEWTGDWSDNSERWTSHPLIRAQCRPNIAGGNDGTFWISFEDFCLHFDSLDVCFRRSGMQDLVLDMNEELGAIGPCVGCLCGCAQYWVGCQGPWKLLCAPHCNNLDKDAADAPGGDVAPLAQESVVGAAISAL